MRRRTAVGVVLALVGCTRVLTDTEVAPVATVRVAPDSTDLPIGTATRLRAFPLDTTGAFRPGATVQWASSDPQVASVDDDGTVTGSGTGTVTITASTRGVQGSARVRVGPAPVLTLDVRSVRFDAQAGQPIPPPQMIAVTNTGGLTLSGLAVGSVTYGAGSQGWLLAQLDATTAPATLTLRAATAGITQAGTYTATIPIASSTATNSPQSIEVVLVVTPGPPATYQMTIAAGNNQLAPVGSALPDDPTVRVTDAFGNPILGLPVTFLVTEGGGSITDEMTLTDAQGLAAVGSWTVEAFGPVPADGRFINRLQASAPSAGAVSITGFAYYSYVTHVHPLWAPSGCTGCHGNLGGFRVSGDAAETYTGELFDVPTACGGGAFKQVAAGGGIAAETNSLLILKLDNASPAVCPAPMPTNGVLIPAAVRDVIRAWIRAGAPMN
ncbi:MAG TPA: Ig-like domain-containing protein [Gemmatimonadales bacterium]